MTIAASGHYRCPIGRNSHPPSEDAVVAFIRRAARQCFSDARGSHDWDHTLRVHGLCRRIGTKAGADMPVLEAAAYLHDIGRADQDHANGSLCHAVRGAERARPIIASLPLDDRRKDNILHCVRAHRFRDDHPPVSVEARVLFDADKLDAIGAVGVARAYLFAGEVGACLHNPDLPPESTRAYSRNDTGYREFVIKLAKIKERMLTEEGRRLAHGRHAFMVAFFEQFVQEYGGNR
ncbi:MAG: HD domain-containing protein [Desulfatitalea sp.]|nr:HD domain-containing protein [Desulfatitalea sp.]NNK01705.1 HD domain-containing protein [Desulfatitalea sp.]